MYFLLKIVKTVEVICIISKKIIKTVGVVLLPVGTLHRPFETEGKQNNLIIY